MNNTTYTKIQKLQATRRKLYNRIQQLNDMRSTEFRLYGNYPECEIFKNMGKELEAIYQELSKEYDELNKQISELGGI